MKQQVVLLSVLVGAAAVAGVLAVRRVLPAGAEEKQSGKRTPVIVELFTSEG
jgi:hypothetical protein